MSIEFLLAPMESRLNETVNKASLGMFLFPLFFLTDVKFKLHLKSQHFKRFEVDSSVAFDIFTIL